MPIFDLHAHWFPQPWIDLLEREAHRNGARITRNDKGHAVIDIEGVALKSVFRPDMIEPAIMLANMDAAKVDVRAMSLTNPMVYWAAPAFGLKLSQAYNDASAALHTAHPERFLGTIMLPLQAPELAVQELDRAAKLPGMRGVYMAMHVGGKNVDDKQLWPVYRRCEELALPILMHPVNPLGIERMRRFHLRNLCGNPYEAGIAAASLIFGGVLDAFPKLDFMLPHAGGTFPWLIGRFDRGVKVRKELAHMTAPASAYLRRFYYDTVSHEPRLIRFLIDLVGADRVVVGSDYNFDMGYDRPVDFVDLVPGLTERERKLILSDNAARLLKL
ncbi:MAG TPA: amidohydrolase family protein [Burkholderiales bacterium]|nr:amidohydrolase family protein [Burkholderiales bacterium]